MNKIAQSKIRHFFFSFLSKSLVGHVLFWLLVFLFLLLLNEGQWSFQLTFTVELINVLFFLIIVYFNLLYLIPNYLTDKKFILYGALLVVFALLLAPIKIVILYFVFSAYPEAQAALIYDQVYFFLSHFVVAGSSTIFKIISDWARHQREKKELQTRSMQTELQFLKSQINPHFLFNTLNNLYALTLKKSDKAPEIVIKLSEMMRYMLYDCNEKRVFLEKELKYIENYLDLEKLRQGKKVDIQFTLDGEVNKQKIAPLLFIPFLENSFKHGLSNVLTHGYVHILVKIEGDKLMFRIENSKPERIASSEFKQVGGIGLVNLKRRLYLQYPDQHELTISETPTHYTATLHITLST